jgi:hypothetical protein
MALVKFRWYLAVQNWRNMPIETLRCWCPRSNNPARKRSVPDNSGDFMEAVFRGTDPVTGFIRFRPEPTGTWQNRQPDTVTGFLRRIPGIFQRVPVGNGVFPAGFSRKFTEYCFRNHRPGWNTSVVYVRLMFKRYLENKLIKFTAMKDTIYELKSIFFIMKKNGNYKPWDHGIYIYTYVFTMC